jgi:hypothetical protein
MQAAPYTDTILATVNSWLAQLGDGLCLFRYSYKNLYIYIIYNLILKLTEIECACDWTILANKGSVRSSRASHRAILA